MKINGKKVPDAWFEREWQRLWEIRRQAPELQAMDENQLRQLTKDHVIDQFVLNEAAQNSDEKIPNKEIDARLKQMIDEAGNEKRFLRRFNLKKKQLPEFKKEIESSIRRQRLFQNILEGVETPTDDDVFEAYKKNPMDFGQPEAAHASHIVKHTNDGSDPEEARAQIEAAKERLDAGEDFTKLCEEYSDCKGQSGDLGWFPKGQMVQRFEEVVFKMDEGKISDVFETEFGFHIALLHEKRPAQITPFDDVKDQLRERLIHEREEEAIKSFAADLRAKAKIEDD